MVIDLFHSYCSTFALVHSEDAFLAVYFSILRLCNIFCVHDRFTVLIALKCVVCHLWYFDYLRVLNFIIIFIVYNAVPGCHLLIHFNLAC